MFKFLQSSESVAWRRSSSGLWGLVHLPGVGQTSTLSVQHHGLGKGGNGPGFFLNLKPVTAGLDIDMSDYMDMGPSKWCPFTKKPDWAYA